MLTGHNFTGMAQGQRARLITARSQDQNLLPVFSNSGFFIEESRHSSSDAKHEQHFTGMAQRLARGAHNSEVTGSKPVAGIFQFRILYRRIPSQLERRKT